MNCKRLSVPVFFVFFLIGGGGEVNGRLVTLADHQNFQRIYSSKKNLFELNFGCIIAYILKILKPKPILCL